MPYIGERRAADLRQGVRQPSNVGDLTYEITRIIVDYLHHKGLSYQTIADAQGALAGTRVELERRVQAPYEQSMVGTGMNLPPLLNSDEARVDPYAALAAEFQNRNAAIQRRAGRLVDHRVVEE